MMWLVKSIKIVTTKLVLFCSQLESNIDATAVEQLAIRRERQYSVQFYEK